MNDIEKMTLKAREAMQASAKMAEVQKHPSVEPEHLLSVVANEPGSAVVDILSRIDPQALATLQKNLKSALDRMPHVTGSSKVLASQRLVELFQKAEQIAQQLGDQFIGLEHFYLAALDLKIMDLHKLVSADQFKKELETMRGGEKLNSEDGDNQYNALEKYSRDLTQMAQEGKLDPVIGRDEEIRRTIQVLARRKKNNPVLIGDPGVGKTAIAEGLAIRIINKDVPEVLFDKRIVSLDMGALIAGACSETRL